MRGAGRLSMADPGGAPERDSASGPALARPAGGTELLSHSDKYPSPVHRGRMGARAAAGRHRGLSRVGGRPAPDTAVRPDRVLPLSDKCPPFPRRGQAYGAARHPESRHDAGRGARGQACGGGLGRRRSMQSSDKVGPSRGGVGRGLCSTRKPCRNISLFNGGCPRATRGWRRGLGAGLSGQSAMVRGRPFRDLGVRPIGVRSRGGRAGARHHGIGGSAPMSAIRPTAYDSGKRSYIHVPENRLSGRPEMTGDGSRFSARFRGACTA